VVMAIGILQHFRRHPEEPGSLPDWHPPLHEPGRGSVPKGMRRYLGGWRGRPLFENPFLTDATGLPLNSTKQVASSFHSFQCRMWASSRGGIGAGV
jgi:hypothetical protein